MRTRAIAFLGITLLTAMVVPSLVVAQPFGDPVYRFYSAGAGAHFYTADSDEKASVIANLSQIYTYEGIAFWLAEIV